MLINLTCPISRLGGEWDYIRYRDYTIDKLRFTAQNAEKMLLKVKNE